MTAPAVRLALQVMQLEDKLAANEAVLEGMTTEAKRHAARAEQLEAELAEALELPHLDDDDPWHGLRAAVATLGPVSGVLPVDVLESTARAVGYYQTRALAEQAAGDRARLSLAVAHAHHMFGVDVDGPPADRVGALYYLRNHGLPEATLDDLDTACEGLETPWGSGPSTCQGCAWARAENAANPTITRAWRCADHLDQPPQTGEDVDF